MGHNFGSPHSHCYNGLEGNASAIDQCYGSESGCYAGATSLRQADRDRLLRVARAVLSFADVIHFLADEFARLRRRGLALTGVAPRALNRGFFWHGIPFADELPGSRRGSDRTPEVRSEGEAARTSLTEC